MKNLYYINIILLLFMSCQVQENEEKQIGINNKEQVNPLNGTWAMTQYFDTILANKSIAKYRMQDATCFALLIDIQQDTMITYGSLFDQFVKIDFTKDTIATIIGLVNQDYWWFIQIDSLITLVQQPNQEFPDSTIYTFRRRPDFLNYGERQYSDYGEKMFRRKSIKKKVISYFNYHLFNEKYQNIRTGDTIVFDGKGNISELKDFKKYETNVYFGTSHPFKNRDVIYFDQHHFYNWVFDGDKLILTKFDWENEHSDDYELTNEVIILKEIK